MRILIVEDDNFKQNAIVSLLQTIAVPIEIETAASLRGAMITLENRAFDFVVLDMAIPSHTSDAGVIDTYSQPVGGLDVLLYLSSNNRPEKVVILTQYPTVEYDRKHVPLKDLANILRMDEVVNIADVVLFTEDLPWRESIKAAIGAVL
jgi:DNA-binding NarL/FixJ family response regulator